MAMQRHDVEFTRGGVLHDPAQLTSLLNALPDITDLLVVSHGWNNDMAEARVLYDQLLENIDKLLAIRDAEGSPPSLAKVTGRTFAACQIYWPSKRFADSELIPGGGSASAHNENDAATVRILEELKDEPERLGDATTSAKRAKTVEKCKALLPRLENDPAARREYVELLRSLLDRGNAHEDDGSDNFFGEDPQVLFANLGEPVMAPPPRIPGGATSIGNAGGAAGLGDLLHGAVAAARRLANFVTYYEMKERAGTVGSGGVATMLRKCRQKKADLKLHLVGHSFGGRLVTAAANTLDANTSAVTISLLQAAFSHNGLSDDFDGKGHAGFFRQLVAEHRASGPFIITHTKNDTAVGIAYPLASRIARQKASAFGDENDPYGGMGRNGAQKTREADGHATDLGEVGSTYTFAPGTINNLRADKFIANHGDVAGIQVAYAILNTAGAV